MQVEVKIDASCAEARVVILTACMTDEVARVIKQLSEAAPQIITGMKDERLEVLEPAELIHAYASGGKVFAVTAKGEYTLRLRLYELEERLSPDRFVRISNSEIINLKKVNSFDLSLTGTICVRLCNGTVTYVSRRCVSKLKRILGI